MSIVTTFPDADLFNSDADVYVNATNSIGVMGAGIAGQFRKRYPGYYASYINATLAPFSIHTYKVSVGNPRAIVSLHTMAYPGQAGNIPMIRSGLTALGAYMTKEKYRTAAIPALGCGIGGLNWKEQVLPLIKEINEKHCSSLVWYVYAPKD